ncbi:hypothetical protein ACTSKR_04395 [Chitinibacteraceae bacterium HSL-7]
MLTPSAHTLLLSVSPLATPESERIVAALRQRGCALVRARRRPVGENLVLMELQLEACGDADHESERLAALVWHSCGRYVRIAAGSDEWLREFGEADYRQLMPDFRLSGLGNGGR